MDCTQAWVHRISAKSITQEAQEDCEEEKNPTTPHQAAPLENRSAEGQSGKKDVKTGSCVVVAGRPVVL